MSVDIGGLRLASSRLQAREVTTDTSGLEVIGTAITGVGEIVQEKEKRDAKAWSIKADSDLRFAGLEALEQAKNEAETPDKIGELFFQKLEQRKSEIGKSAPNQFAVDEYNNIYENVRKGLGQNAIQTELEQTSELRRRQIDDSIQKGINFVRNGGSYSDTQALMQKYYEQADGVLDPVELDSYKREGNKQLKQSFLEYRFEKGDIAGVQKLINDDKFAQDFTGKEIGAYRNAIARQKQEVQKTAQTDPAAFAILNGAKTTDEIVEYQRGMGIPENQISVIPSQQAKLMVANLKNVSSAEEFTQVMQELKATYGQYSTNAINDLIKQKLPSAYLFGANLDPSNGQDAEALTYLYDSIRGDDKQLKELVTTKLKASDKKYSDLELEVSTAMEDELQYFIDENKSPEVINSIYNNALNIAASRYLRTGDINSSVSFAQSVVAGDFQIGMHNNKAFKVPLSYDLDKVEDALDSIADTVEIVIANEERREFIEPFEKAGARWVSNSNRDGLIYVNQFGEPLVSKETNDLIEYTFDELIKMEKKFKKSAIQQELQGGLPQLEKLLKESN